MTGTQRIQAVRFNEIRLGLPMSEVCGGMRWPMHLLFIQGSIGICIITLLYRVSPWLPQRRVSRDDPER